ncbi:pyrroline-5-carboxylate reductase [Aminobacter sp. Piv2-1]|uniref:pyrroline-5-carboxylate reductase n=1 Tax=Aminobacter sp. Piv2-1 TaxID=3031122 RepID=UPI0030ACC0B0
MTLASSRMLFIGCGNMGAAIINGIAERHPNVEIVAVDPSVDRARSLLKRPELVLLRQTLPASEAERFDVVLLAIKPQMLSQSVDEIVRFTEGALVVSIMAGITTPALRTKLRTDRVIRTMPNLAAEIGYSMTVGFADADLVSKDDRILASELLACIGRVEWLSSESDIDRATAISGSGPGFVFAIAEDLISAAIAEGLAPEVADTLVRQMLLGSARLLVSSTKPPSSLKVAVTSPKGTTEAGLSVLQHEKTLALLLARAVRAAHERARELGG